MLKKSLLLLAFLAVGHGQLVKAVSVVKRSDDDPITARLDEAVTSLNAQVQALQDQFSAMSSIIQRDSHPVAFAVGLNDDVITNIYVGMTIKYDDIFINEGNVYDPVTGMFTAPISGLYVIYYKTEVAAHKIVGLELMKEGTKVAHIWAGNSGTFETAGDMEVIHLSKGQRLWVVFSGVDGYLRGNHATRLSGFLLKADSTDTK